MRAIIVDEKHSNKRIDRYIKEVFPRMPFGAVQKAFRKKDIKVNGVRVKQDYAVMPGDKLEIYIIDEILDGLAGEDDTRQEKGFTVVYEDANILIVNKEQGVPVHPDRGQSSNTLIDLIREYEREKGGYSAKGPSTFPPSLCHRLDRNTGGLIIIAKNQESLNIILAKMETREIRKHYQCLVKGRMERESAQLKAYLIKDENKSRVFVNENKTAGAVEIITKYKALSYDPANDVSRLEVELVTGRTHQIRAHLAHIGHPVVGDGKYGTNAINRPLGAKYQALWATKIEFDMKDAGILNYLKGREFRVEPGFSIRLK